MGLFGPAKNTQRTSARGVKTGGAGNNGWYNSTIAAAASSSRPTSASFHQTNGGGGGAQAQMQQRPASAQRQQQQFQQTQQQPQYQQTAGYPVNPDYTSALQPTQQYYPSAAAASSSFSPSRQLNPTSNGRPATAARRVPGQPLPLEAVAHEEDCICTVCTCGKHGCPPTPRTTHYDPAIASEARQAYQGTFKPAVRAKAPGQWVARDVPFEGISTTKADYKAHPVSMTRSALGARGALMDTGVGRNSAPFDDTTTHKSDYPAHPLLPRNSGGPRNGNLSTDGPDDRDFSTTTGNYKPHPLQARQSRPVEEARPSLPFAGQSTNHSDFPAYANARPAVPKFRSSPFAPHPEDRDFSSENRTEFIPKKLELCPAIPVAGPGKIYPGHVAVEMRPGTSVFQRTGLPVGAARTQRV